MLLLFETAAGFALFKVLQEGKVTAAEPEDFCKDFESLESAQKVVKLKAFQKFENTTEALAAATSIGDSKLSKGLKKFLKKNTNEKDTLAVLDAKLGNIVKEKTGIQCISNNGVMELARGVRAQLEGLISGLADTDLTPMSLGLSHSLSRYKLKFSPDKVDTMIVQAIGLLDDLDKELNTYAMRVREWYGWHFPEMTRVVSDNIQYALVVKHMQMRENAATTEFEGILEEEVRDELRETATISMGTEISVDDMSNITALCDQVVELAAYRAQLYEYLKSRMAAIAPNLTVLVGELVGARLIAHAGSLMTLAKYPASTVQILGAEKALFRALKTKHETPKYGLIYHASLIGQAAPKNKGKMSRILAAKASLATRVDAMGTSDDATIGIDSRTKIEARLRQMEGRDLGQASATTGGANGAIPKYDRSKQGAAPGLASTAAAYNPDADVSATAAGSEKKKKKRKAELTEVEDAVVHGVPEAAAEAGEQPKKKKKKAKAADDEAPALENGQPEAASEKKKKKKADRYFDGAEAAEPTAAPATEETPKKKKKKKAAE
mmetsp:Transcript_10474/g.31543  ORF Transcript_10474/g.31543 Transcript_10474/m.31543 type:complete len:552 (-) Transcript_10474:219-1874(-)|eukprot:CAMPEP_0206141354 /NCGR_PEP_ID=MMETSP1473-20131121/12649_1 /ASSEMBLY_ACC=CAM_ASM_001109 /TAXON_ID=1461547 /ORGANISM="Stichococcus sp, Strain RCC1054" /LENGTH=551 /DNA_ID=CAMNT_0053535885 /DNA_START=86 /DNA_END=1741 /DNA_ORIENTATION=+